MPMTRALPRRRWGRAAVAARRAAGSARGAFFVRTQARSGDGRSAPAETAHGVPRDRLLASAAGAAAATTSTASIASRHRSGMRADLRVTLT